MEPSTCVVCEKPTTHLCAACKSALYCGRECQVAAWKGGHKKTCAALPTALRKVQFRLAGPEASPLCTRTNKKVETTSETGFEGYYVHPESARGDLGAYLAALGAVIAVDDSLFVQLLSAAEDGSGDLCFAVGDFAPWLALKRICPKGAAMQSGFFTPGGPARVTAGQWLAGPDEKERYLGMTSGGPVRMPLPQWHEHVVKTLKSKMDVMPPDVRQQTELLMRIGDLDFGKFTLLRKCGE